MEDKLNDIIIITVFCLLLGSIILVLFTDFGKNIQDNLSFFNLILTSFVALATFMTVKEMQKQRKAQHTPELIIPEITLFYDGRLWFETSKDLKEASYYYDLGEEFFVENPDAFFEISKNYGAYITVYNVGTGLAKNIKAYFETDSDKIVKTINEEYLNYSEHPKVNLSYNSLNNELKILEDQKTDKILNVVDKKHFFPVMLPYNQDPKSIKIPLPKIISEIYSKLIDVNQHKMPNVPIIAFKLILNYQDIENKPISKEIFLEICNFGRYLQNNEYECGIITVKMKN